MSRKDGRPPKERDSSVYNGVKTSRNECCRRRPFLETRRYVYVCSIYIGSHPPRKSPSDNVYGIIQRGPDAIWNLQSMNRGRYFAYESRACVIYFVATSWMPA